MQTNNTLHSAKKAKNDEFYTRLEDISAELKFYKDKFENQTVYCNCDNPEFSNFWKYFHLNFSELKLKKLIATFYTTDNTSYKAVYCGGNDNDITAYEKFDLTENGDFRSNECLEILNECDIVVTNPPFSLFRDFVATLIKADKKYLIIGNQNAIGYKEIFPLLRENKMWLGVNTNKSWAFRVPDGYKWNEKITNKINDGYHYGVVNSISWFTNIDHNKRHEKLVLWKKYTPEEYPKYDNFDAINVDRLTDIPCDYYGVMGVPITFMNVFNPEQFEIVSFRKGNDGKDLVFTDEKGQKVNCYSRILTKYTEKDIYIMNNPKDSVVNGKSKYVRIGVKKKI